MSLSLTVTLDDDAAALLGVLVGVFGLMTPTEGRRPWSIMRSMGCAGRAPGSADGCTTCSATSTLGQSLRAVVGGGLTR